MRRKSPLDSKQVISFAHNDDSMNSAGYPPSEVENFVKINISSKESAEILNEHHLEEDMRDKFEALTTEHVNTKQQLATLLDENNEMRMKFTKLLDQFQLFISINESNKVSLVTTHQQ